MSSTIKRLSYSNEFDIIRLVLSCAVLFQHSETILNTPNFLNLSSIPAVPIFIFISGLLVTESLIFSTSIQKYFIKRIRRILPGYYFVVIFGGFSLFIINNFFINEQGISIFNLIKYYAFNLLFLNFLHPCIQNIDTNTIISNCAINGSLWTIKFELFFYLILPIIFLLARNSTKFFIFLTTLCLVLLALGADISIYIRIFICFFAGVGFSMIRQHWRFIYKFKKINSILRFSLVIFLILLSGWRIVPLYLILPLLLLSSFYPTKDSSKDLKISKYGDLSYGIYLIHFPIIRILGSFPMFTELNGFILSFLVLLLSVIGSYFLYWKVERRFLNQNSHYYKSSN